MLRILGLRLSTDRYIEKTQGQMLLHTWNERHQERDFRKNLFQGLSRILLNIARVPLPRIGSFTVNDDGSLLLANRPLSVVVQQLENEQIPVDIPRHLTYTSVDSYVIDILNCLHDSRLRHQPNGASDKSDCIYQMSALAAMKAVSSLFLRRDLCHGPFLFNLTDLHQSNIFVDEIWNITCLIDLEWALSSPIEMIYPPRWLANQDINQMLTNARGDIRPSSSRVHGYFGAHRAGALHPASSETFACHETSVGNGDVLVYSGSS